MKYAVISCVERELVLEAVCDTFAEARSKMKEHFLAHHFEHGMDEEEVEELKFEIETAPDLECSEYGFHNDFAWSNFDDDLNYDIKIFEIS